MRRIRNIFITGLVVCLPIALTLWILTRLFNFLDSIFGDIIALILGYRIPGLGLILVFGFVFGVGIVASNVIGKRITRFVEGRFAKIPIIRTIYQPLRDILSNISKRSSDDFKKAVFVKFPNDASTAMGFITKDNIIINGEERTAVFVPTTPNPTSGFLIYLKKTDYQELDIPVETALKTIISLGTVTPDMIMSKEASGTEE